MDTLSSFKKDSVYPIKLLQFHHPHNGIVGSYMRRLIEKQLVILFLLFSNHILLPSLLCGPGG